MSNAALFVIGVLVTIPAATVIIALLFAAGFDERAEKTRRVQADPATAQPGDRALSPSYRAR